METASPEHAALWTEIAGSLLRSVLGEEEPIVALRDALAAFERDLGVPCAVEEPDGRVVAASPGAVVRSPLPGSSAWPVEGAWGAARLLCDGGIPAQEGARLAKVVGLMLTLETRLTVRTRHDLNNRVAGLLANLELLESLGDDAFSGGGEAGATAKRALALALGSARALAALLYGEPR